jgi:2-keto-4-pentenoate hydratase
MANRRTREDMVMEQRVIEEAARLLVAARGSGGKIEGLPKTCQPTTLAEANAIQNQTVTLLGETVEGWKVGAKWEDMVMRGAILRSRLFESPARIPAALMPLCGVEPEIAFQFKRDMPPRPAAYTRAEVEDAVLAFAGIEIVDSRFLGYPNAPVLDKAADFVSNGGFVRGSRNTGWRDVDLTELLVTVSFDGEVVARVRGGHPTKDPILPALELVNQLRHEDGIKAGQFMTTGTMAGITYAKPGQAVTAKFENFGTAAVRFVA